MQLGAAAAKALAQTIHDLLQTQPLINIVFAAAPSQNEFLSALLEETIPWHSINAFHMDEYIGLDAASGQTFAGYLKEHLFEKVSCNAVYYMNGNAADLAAECNRYSLLLKNLPVDIVCMGIGENNHIAFNDPPVADFNDPQTVKIVTLDESCRQQQVNDNCFSSLKEVPTRAITLTIPALLNCKHILCMVPGERKAKAVYHTISSAVTEQYPSTILRKHDSVRLFLDKDSSKMI